MVVQRFDLRAELAHHLAIHDYAPAASNCAGTIPNTATANLLNLQLFNADGGALSTGVYTITEPALPSAGLGASVQNNFFSPQAGVVTTSVGLSGTTTISELTATRIAGSFQAGVFIADGGMGTLSGTFDSPLCP